MNPQDFFDQLDEAKVVRAIRLAELRTSGEIRVFVSRRASKPSLTAMERAKKRFLQLGLTKTRDRNGVLLYFQPRAREFAIVGDVGIVTRCPDLWSQVVEEIGPILGGGDFTGAVVRAVERVGQALEAHFPRRGDDRNELPDTVITD